MADYITENKSFIVYKDWEQYVSMLSDEETGKLFKALFAFARGGEVRSLEGMTAMAFAFMRTALERDGKKWEETVSKRREGGKKGGRPPKTSGEKNLPETLRFSEKVREPDKETVKDTVNETDKDNVNDNETDIETVTGTERDILAPYGKYLNVMLDNAQYRSLCSMSSSSETEKYIDKLSSWLSRTGNSCKNAYSVISGWIRQDRERSPGFFHEESEDGKFDEYENFALNFSLSGRNAGNPERSD
ncbi:MAG: hypothetical protein J5994_08945 [Ruminococcus sp.]|nr:hypothetical protein [Ruminococcus sp.]